MLSSLLVSPSSDFWMHAVQCLLDGSHSIGRTYHSEHSGKFDFSACQVVVPAFSHAQSLRSAMATVLHRSFIPPRINTLSGLLSMFPPTDGSTDGSTDGERLMLLYAELRQHAWLKKMFAARSDVDLLPLAQTLVSLSDELTQALLPVMQRIPGDVDARWEAALGQLSPVARHLLSDEAQLVWSIWKSQLDNHDKTARRHAQMQAIAMHANMPLIWINPVAPDAMEQAFLDTYALHQEVQVVTLDWRESGIPTLFRQTWQELCEPRMVLDEAGQDEAADAENAISAVEGLALCPAISLEDAAQQSAQIVLEWLRAGKTNIAVVAQDRVTARRMRALLERAQVVVADETGWKLSTTRAAAAIVAWCDIITSRVATSALLDFMKSPFLFASLENKPALIMQVEWQLRRKNIAGDWSAILGAFAPDSDAYRCLNMLAQQASAFRGKKSLTQWSELSYAMLEALDMLPALMEDSAGQQVLLLLEDIARDSNAVGAEFTFAEWRALLSLQFDATTFMVPTADRRVVMLPLNGARLRSFDAVLVLGADADHLPSQPKETLFFSNAVRHELGLETRASRQHQQLRDVVELLCANQEVVLCWQTHKDGEPNPVSSWIERLQLKLAKAGLPELRQYRCDLPERHLMLNLSTMPTPSAPDLIPAKLSASAYSSFVACPYQFFATRMLRVTVMDELSDTPEKRDYGGWLHEILMIYHETVRDQKTPYTERYQLLETISQRVFDATIAQQPSALAYAARWKKVIPAYLEWAAEREAQGWYFVLAEVPLQHPLEWSGGGIELYGRLDRVDENEQGERAVLDYKTRNKTALTTKLKDEEDHQLAFYGLLSGQTLSAAHYVALEIYKEKTGDVAAKDFPQKQMLLRDQIVVGMQAVTQGAALPANGIDAVCQYCEVRGMCRKGMW